MKKPIQVIQTRERKLGEIVTQTVDGRELHGFLGSKQQFADWIKSKIDKYGFVENEDYVVFHKSMKNPQVGRPEIDYTLSIDMAKELGMLEANEKGKQIRKYFIEMEKYAVWRMRQDIQTYKSMECLNGNIERVAREYQKEKETLDYNSLRAYSIYQRLNLHLELIDSLLGVCAAANPSEPSSQMLQASHKKVKKIINEYHNVMKDWVDSTGLSMKKIEYVDDGVVQLKQLLNELEICEGAKHA